MIVCNICKSSSINILHSLGKYKIVECKKCGFVFTDKIMHVHNFVYGEDYFKIDNPETGKRGYRSYENDKPHHLYYFEKKIKLINKFISRGKILDVGCALGFFLEEANKAGFNPYGLDVSEYAVKYALKKFPSKVFCKALEDSNFKNGSFNVITFFQTIEHLEDPLKTLMSANKLLSRGGILVIACPNHDSILRKIMGRHWFEYKPEEHLNYFDKRSLNSLLGKTGFKLICMESDMFFYPIGYILERLSYYSPTSLLKKFFYIVYKFIDNFFIKNVRIPLPLGGMMVVAQKK